MNREDFYKLYFNTLLELLFAAPMFIIAWAVIFTDNSFLALYPLLYFVTRGLDYALELWVMNTIQKESPLLCYMEKGSKTLKTFSVLLCLYSFYIVVILNNLEEF